MQINRTIKTVALMFAAGLLAASALSADSPKIVPYLQAPTESSIWVTWKTASNTESKVCYGKTVALGAEAAAACREIAPGYFWHTVKLSGLNPDTAYFYKCVTGGQESEVCRFRTQPVPGSTTGHYRFLIYSDSHSSTSAAAIHKQVVDAVIAKCKELSGNADLLIEDYLNLVVSTGDVVDRSDNVNAYQTGFIEPAASLCSHVPYMIAVGNHEYVPRSADKKHSGVTNFFAHVIQDDLDYKGLKCPEEENYYAFQAGRAVFVMLNRMIEIDLEKKWMDSVMAAAEADRSVDWLFAFCHHPSFSEPIPADGKDSSRLFIQMMGQYPKAVLFASGHTHGYGRGAGNDQDVHAVRTGGGGGSLSRWRHDDPDNKPRDYPEVQKSFDVYNYVIMDIDLAGKSFIGRTYSLGNKDRKENNTLLDSFHKRIGAKKPDRPKAIAPAGTTLSISTTMCFRASAYAGGGEELNSSRFQITARAGVYTNCLVDVKRDFENIFGDSGPPAWPPIDLNKGMDITSLVIDGVAAGLVEGKTYYWRVRYRNTNLQWSDWSEEASFIAAQEGRKNKE